MIHKTIQFYTVRAFWSFRFLFYLFYSLLFFFLLFFLFLHLLLNETPDVAPRYLLH